MNDLKIMAYLFVMLIVLYVASYFYMLVRKSRIEKKAEDYHNLLKQALVARRKYIKALTVADGLKLKLDDHLEKLHVAKMRLQSARNTVRESIAVIRARQAENNKPDKVEINIIAQKIILVSQHWKVLNNFRCQFMVVEKAYRVVEKENNEHARNLTTVSRVWELDKNKLMSLYKELRPMVKVRDPRLAFSSSG